MFGRTSDRPRVIGALNGIGRVAERAGLRAVRLDPERIAARAMRKTGLDDFGDDSFREPLEVLARAANESPTLTLFGRLFARNVLEERLSNRLRIEAALCAEPSILEEPIERPIFIVSPPRTGTTLLHRLLGEDPENRVLQQWEIDHPCPPPEEATYERDPRIAQTEREIRVFDWVAPRFKSIHELGARLPEECIGLFANDLHGVWFTVGLDLPAYSRWYQAQDLVPLYRRHRRQLALLSSRFRRERWVLKAPMHLLGLGALLEVYPDARIIQTHRDPTRVVPSEASLFATMRDAFHDDVDRRAVGRELLDDLSRWCAASMDARARAEADPKSDVEFFDLAYEDIVADPVRSVRRVYERFELPLADAAEARMRAYLERNSQHKLGRHRYSLQEFGLSVSDVRDGLGAYCERFDVPCA